MRSGRWRSLDGRFGLPLAALLVALPMMWLSLPRMVAEMAALPGSFHLHDVSFGRTVPVPILETMAESQRRALGFVDSPRYWENLALVSVQRARAAGYVTPEGRQQLREAVAATRKSLERSPLQMRAWFRLSHGLVALYGPSAEAADALAISLILGPNEDYLYASRFLLISRLWTFLDEEGRNRARDVMRKRSALRLAMTAAGYREGMDMLRLAFAEYPDFLSDIERGHEQQLQRSEQYRRLQERQSRPQ